MSEISLKLGIAAAALGDDPRAVPRLARTGGFDGLLYDACSTTLDLTTLSATGRREFARLLSSQDRQLVGLRADLGRNGVGVGADVDRAIARIDRAMQAAKGLGSPLVCVDLGPLPQPATPARSAPKVSAQQAGVLILPTARDIAAIEQSDPAAAPPDPAFVSQVADALTELGIRADRYGVIVAFRSDLASFAALEGAVVPRNCSWFGIDLDPAAALGDAWDLDEIFSRLGPLIRHVRGRDALLGTDRRTRPAVVGKGDVKWGHVLSNLDEAGYRGWVTIDPMELSDRAGAAVAGREHLHSGGSNIPV